MQSADDPDINFVGRLSKVKSLLKGLIAGVNVREYNTILSQK